MRKIILVIDEDDQNRKILRITLETNGYQVIESASISEAMYKAEDQNLDLIMLDLELQDEHGQKPLEKLRARYTKPIIVISIHSAEENIVVALENGANDYLTKPFKAADIINRISFALHNTTTDIIPIFKSNDLEIDQLTKTVKIHDKPVNLTDSEFRLLSFFVRNQNRILTARYLLRQVWGPGYINQSQYLRVCISECRKKIEEDRTNPKYIITESGIGYRFVNNTYPNITD